MKMELTDSDILSMLKMREKDALIISNGKWRLDAHRDEERIILHVQEKEATPNV